MRYEIAIPRFFWFSAYLTLGTAIFVIMSGYLFFWIVGWFVGCPGNYIVLHSRLRSFITQVVQEAQVG